MKITHSVICILLLISGSAFSADEADLKFETAASIPPHVLETFRKYASSKKYAFSDHLNPFFIQGDFNGDGKLDAAILLREKASKKLGIGIVHSGSASVSILGAGHDFGNGGDDFSWMDAWHAYPRTAVHQGAEEGPPPKLKGDALMVIKTESASALVYWTGKAYVWYQQGD